MRTAGLRAPARVLGFFGLRKVYVEGLGFIGHILGLCGAFTVNKFKNRV